MNNLQGCKHVETDLSDVKFDLEMFESWSAVAAGPFMLIAEYTELKSFVESFLYIGMQHQGGLL